MNKKRIIGIVSGYWNPLHAGHLDYIKESKKQCDYLIVIVNNDKQVKLKGSKPFMDEKHRCVIMNSLKYVDQVRISRDNNKTVKKTLITIRENFPNDNLIFFNSGDRSTVENIDVSEAEVCKKLDIEYVFIDKPKIYSSSDILKQL